MVGLCGIAALLLSFFVLPWISEGGDDVTFDDLHDAFQAQEEASEVGDPSLRPPVDDSVRDLRQYTDWGWLLVIYLSVACVVFTAWVIAPGPGGRVATGLLMNPCIGVFNVVDQDGTRAPRIIGAITALYALTVQGLNMWHLFWEEDGSPDPALGALLGLGGSIAVVVACLIGTKRQRVWA